MATWAEEFNRISELHRAATEDWKAGANNGNAVANTADDVKAFMIRWMGNGSPMRTQEM